MNDASEALTGDTLLTMLDASRQWIGFHRERLNDQNVYPVPDGDTGTNLWLTLNSALSAAQAAGPGHAGKLWSAAAQGALEGSRGNSGVILSQFMQGMAEEFSDQPTLDPMALRHAFDRASDRAYRAVDQPQRGTILTVAQDVAEAVQARGKGRDVTAILELASTEAQASVKRTPELLPVLKQAHVVDAGGWGLALFLEGMLKALRREHIPTVMMSSENAASDPPVTLEEIPDPVHGFDVQFLVHHPSGSVEDIRTRIASMGDHALVEGNPDQVKVHVHVMDPGPVLSYGCGVGFITDVVVENMDAMAAQAAQRRKLNQTPDAGAGTVRLLTPAPEDGVAVVAVSTCPGFSDLFGTLGVHCLIQCPHTYNPSVAQFREAMALAGGARSLLLPNNRNAMASARQLQAEFPPSRLAIMDTPSVLNGVSAMYGFESALDWSSLVDGMERQAGRIVHGAVAQSTRDLEAVHGPVAAGAYLAMAWGRDILAAHGSAFRAAQALIQSFLLPESDRRPDEEYGYVTLYRGEDATPSDDRRLERWLEGQAADYEFEWVDTRQPHYVYLIAVE